MLCSDYEQLDTSYIPSLEWRTARIPKKSGGVRILHIPNDELKQIQHKVLLYLYAYDELRPAFNVAGFVPNRDIMTGAKIHSVGSGVVINMDFKDFFDNVDSKMAAHQLLRAGVPATVVDYIMRVCTLDGKFSQGAPTSPYLTNIALRRFDVLMTKFCANRGFTYSRYADDITLALTLPDTGAGYNRYNYIQYITTHRGRQRLATGYIYRLIRSVQHLAKFVLPTVPINKKKTRVAHPCGMIARQVTGVVLRNDFMGYNAKRKFRDVARAMCHNLYKQVMQNPRKVAQLRPKWARLKGCVTFMNRVRRQSQTQIGRAPDPRINAKQWEYLESKFQKIPKKASTTSKPSDKTSQGKKTKGKKTTKASRASKSKSGSTRAANK